MSITSRFIGWVFKLPPTETHDVVVEKDLNRETKIHEKLQRKQDNQKDTHHHTNNYGELFHNFRVQADNPCSAITRARIVH